MRDPRVIVITGASAGIGAALAMHYAKKGVTLCLTGRNSVNLETVASMCRSRGAEVRIKRLDVTDAPAMEQWLQELDAEIPVDLVIANAGISGGSGGGSIHAEEPAQVRAILATNVDGVVNTVLPLMPAMAKRRRGQIALMGSLAGYRGMPSAPAYSTSKAAVLAYGKALRGWLAKQGVEVSVVTPGYIRTALTARNPFPMPFLMEPEQAARIIARGLARNKGVIAFPLPLFLGMWVASNLLPGPLGDFIFSRLPAKPAIGEG